MKGPSLLVCQDVKGLRGAYGGSEVRSVESGVRNIETSHIQQRTPKSEVGPPAACLKGDSDTSAFSVRCSMLRRLQANTRLQQIFRVPRAPEGTRRSRRKLSGIKVN